MKKEVHVKEFIGFQKIIDMPHTGL